MSRFYPVMVNHIVWNMMPESARRCHSFRLLKKLLNNFGLLEVILFSYFIMFQVQDLSESIYYI